MLLPRQASWPAGLFARIIDSTYAAAHTPSKSNHERHARVRVSEWWMPMVRCVDPILGPESNTLFVRVFTPM